MKIFKQKLLTEVIPRIEMMLKQEKHHLDYLIENNAPQELINLSRRTYNHLFFRLKDYKEYADELAM